MAESPAVTTLCENSNEEFLDASKLLITYADNILRNPNEEKYRSIRIGNPTFSTKLLPIKGAVECLFEMGFEEAETHLVFPKSASVDQLKLIRESIAAEREQRLRGGQPVHLSAQAATTSPPAQTPGSSAGASSQPIPSLAAQPSSLESSMSFFVTLQSNFQHVMLYENVELQQKARSCIPHQQISSTAEHRLKEAKEADPDCKLGMEDILVLELLSWFKNNFFSWVDSLPCSRCGGPTQNSGMLSATPDDIRWGAQRVENHHCESCRLSTRFPRYNNPEKLLETRRGRCGEWANCFTLCCRAMGLEARYVWDSTDHVWTEIYSPSQRRWLHCDPCENACDKPLLYEVGWGKKLAYILAFSKDQVVDVTWRYSCKHPEVLTRRTRVQEAWLLHTINGLNASRQQFLGPDRKKVLTERLLVELVEFISPKKPKSGELGGRNSGSLAWRLARGETRGPDTATSAQAAGFVFTPTEKEQSSRLLHVRYSASKDQYCRLSNNSELIQSWDQCVWRKESVFRKLENDWQMAYIARTEGSSEGKISWKFDSTPVGMKIKSISVMASSQTFHSGKVCWHLKAGLVTTEFTGDGKMQSFQSLSGSSEFVIVAELSGGDGDASWQHAQIFRQSLKEMEEASFEILVHLEDA
ncbi:peptide-N(4)-(N-acetyl-beta-glucosaminyl)asparagine amidase [Cheilinus undulatus]|uniref:peptide-N(4)-(N-acetyl-beta- glucosaminyl)asparagine amidase n=1 Tax=Cheilinus undulatus TaxID=241271 RepID=UPI001BD51C10|nr:peptide-N(4)-(N-acetyl-beta-glucosaminyl)asparagine amidase [Cheilinus undulatus]XP_041665213.1 peptide-N(4)-(N-acetyl-beta-glucosaminyl)asparagine amidase [Cheilinus undulatus]